MNQILPGNQSTPELVMDMKAVARVLSGLECGHFVRVSGSGDVLGVTDGRLFMWFRAPQRCGTILRRQYRIDALNTQVALHFQILRECARTEVAKVFEAHARKRMYPITRKRGYWYEVHGD